MTARLPICLQGAGALKISYNVSPGVATGTYYGAEHTQRRRWTCLPFTHQPLQTAVRDFGSFLAAGTREEAELVYHVFPVCFMANSDKGRKFPELKFKYVEEEQPEEFFIPYVWSLVYNSGVGLHWNPQDIQLFTMDSG
ncbi:hypothetical protein FKM82_022628 [Ascaphus truei]